MPARGRPGQSKVGGSLRLGRAGREDEEPHGMDGGAVFSVNEYTEEDTRLTSRGE